VSTTCFCTWLSCRHMTFTLDFPDHKTVEFRDTHLDILWTQSASLTSRLPLRITGIMVSCTGHLFDLQGRRHLWERTMATRSHRRSHISTTCIWLDPTSILCKACFLPTTPSYSMLGLVAKVYEPRDFVDPSYIKTESDKGTASKYTINTTYQGSTKECCGFYPICQKSIRNSYTCSLQSRTNNSSSVCV
jgi:hypothetical protein